MSFCNDQTHINLRNYNVFAKVSGSSLVNNSDKKLEEILGLAVHTLGNQRPYSAPVTLEGEHLFAPAVSNCLLNVSPLITGRKFEAKTSQGNNACKPHCSHLVQGDFCSKSETQVHQGAHVYIPPLCLEQEVPGDVPDKYHQNADSWLSDEIRVFSSTESLSSMKTPRLAWKYPELRLNLPNDDDEDVHISHSFSSHSCSPLSSFSSSDCSSFSCDKPLSYPSAGLEINDAWLFDKITFHPCLSTVMERQTSSTVIEEIESTDGEKSIASFDVTSPDYVANVVKIVRQTNSHFAHIHTSPKSASSHLTTEATKIKVELTISKEEISQPEASKNQVIPMASTQQINQAGATISKNDFVTVIEPIDDAEVNVLLEMTSGFEEGGKIKLEIAKSLEEIKMTTCSKNQVEIENTINPMPVDTENLVMETNKEITFAPSTPKEQMENEYSLMQIEQPFHSVQQNAVVTYKKKDRKILTSRTGVRRAVSDMQVSKPGIIKQQVMKATSQIEIGSLVATKDQIFGVPIKERSLKEIEDPIPCQVKINQPEASSQIEMVKICKDVPTPEVDKKQVEMEKNNEQIYKLEVDKSQVDLEQSDVKISFSANDRGEIWMEKVTEEINLPANIENKVTEEINLPANIKNKVTEEINLPASIENEVTEEINLPANIKNKVTEEINLTADIENKVTEEINLTANIKNKVTEEINLPANIKNKITEEINLTANIENKVTAGINLPANVKNKVTEEINLPANIENKVTEEINLPANIKNKVTEGINLTANIKNKVTEEINLTTDIESKVTEEINLTANIKNKVTEEINLPANIENKVTEEINLTANVKNKVTEEINLPANIENKVTEEINLPANIENKVTEEINLTANVKNKVTEEINLPANIENKVTEEINLPANIKNKVTEGINLTANIKNKVTEEINLTTDIESKVTEEINLTANIKNKVTEEINLPANIENKVTEEINLPANVKNKVTEEINLTANIRNKVTEEINLPANIENKVTEEIDLPASIKNKVTEAASKKSVNTSISESHVGLVDTTIPLSPQNEVTDQDQCCESKAVGSQDQVVTVTIDTTLHWIFKTPREMEVDKPMLLACQNIGVINKDHVNTVAINKNQVATVASDQQVSEPGVFKEQAIRYKSQIPIRKRVTATACREQLRRPVATKSQIIQASIRKKIIKTSTSEGMITSSANRKVVKKMKTCIPVASKDHIVKIISHNEVVESPIPNHQMVEAAVDVEINVVATTDELQGSNDDLNVDLKNINDSNRKPTPEGVITAVYIRSTRINLDEPPCKSPKPKDTSPIFMSPSGLEDLCVKPQSVADRESDFSPSATPSITIVSSPTASCGHNHSYGIPRESQEEEISAQNRINCIKTLQLHNHKSDVPTVEMPPENLCAAQKETCDTPKMSISILPADDNANPSKEDSKELKSSTPSPQSPHAEPKAKKKPVSSVNYFTLATESLHEQLESFAEDEDLGGDVESLHCLYQELISAKAFAEERNGNLQSSYKKECEMLKQIIKQKASIEDELESMKEQDASSDSIEDFINLDEQLQSLKRVEEHQHNFMSVLQREIENEAKIRAKLEENARKKSAAKPKIEPRMTANAIRLKYKNTFHKMEQAHEVNHAVIKNILARMTMLSAEDKQEIQAMMAKPRPSKVSKPKQTRPGINTLKRQQTLANKTQNADDLQSKMNQATKRQYSVKVQGKGKDSSANRANHAVKLASRTHSDNNLHSKATQNIGGQLSFKVQETSKDQSAKKAHSAVSLKDKSHIGFKSESLHGANGPRQQSFKRAHSACSVRNNVGQCIRCHSTAKDPGESKDQTQNKSSNSDQGQYLGKDGKTAKIQEAREDLRSQRDKNFKAQGCSEGPSSGKGGEMSKDKAIKEQPHFNKTPKRYSVSDRVWRPNQIKATASSDKSPRVKATTTKGTLSCKTRVSKLANDEVAKARSSSPYNNTVDFKKGGTKYQIKVGLKESASESSKKQQLPNIGDPSLEVIVSKRPCNKVILSPINTALKDDIVQTVFDMEDIHEYKPSPLKATVIDLFQDKENYLKAKPEQDIRKVEMLDKEMVTVKKTPRQKQVHKKEAVKKIEKKPGKKIPVIEVYGENPEERGFTTQRKKSIVKQIGDENQQKRGSVKDVANENPKGKPLVMKNAGEKVEKAASDFSLSSSSSLDIVSEPCEYEQQKDFVPIDKLSKLVKTEAKKPQKLLKQKENPSDQPKALNHDQDDKPGIHSDQHKPIIKTQSLRSDVKHNSLTKLRQNLSKIINSPRNEPSKNKGARKKSVSGDGFISDLRWDNTTHEADFKSTAPAESDSIRPSESAVLQPKSAKKDIGPKVPPAYANWKPPEPMQKQLERYVTHNALKRHEDQAKEKQPKSKQKNAQQEKLLPLRENMPQPRVPLPLSVVEKSRKGPEKVSKGSSAGRKAGKLPPLRAHPKKYLSFENPYLRKSVYG